MVVRFRHDLDKRKLQVKPVEYCNGNQRRQADAITAGIRSQESGVRS